MSRIVNTEVITPKSLSPEARRELIDALYAVHNQIFDGVERQSFAKYVVESKAEHTWIQVHKNEAGEIVGYFAFHIFERQLGGVPMAVFRAEAGTLRAYRGGNVNARFGLALALRYLLKNPGRRVYYLGSLVHPSSYAQFARYCGEVWPRRDVQTPAEVQSFMEELASEFGLETVDEARPLVRKVGWKTRETEAEREYWQHCDKPAARFFIEANPGYVEGHGLVTVVPVTAATLLGMLRTLGERKLRQPVEAALALVRGMDRYGQLGRQGRRSWLRQGEHRELSARQALTVEPGTHMLVLSGTVELAHAGPQVAAQGVLLLEAQHPLRVVAQESARIVLLPRGAELAREASLAKAA